MRITSSTTPYLTYAKSQRNWNSSCRESSTLKLILYVTKVIPKMWLLQEFFFRSWFRTLYIQINSINFIKKNHNLYPQHFISSGKKQGKAIEAISVIASNQNADNDSWCIEAQDRSIDKRDEWTKWSGPANELAHLSLAGGFELNRPHHDKLD